MVENIYIKKGETFEKKILFEDLDYLRSITSCSCTATKQVEIKNNGFEVTVTYKGSKVGAVNQWIKFTVTKKGENNPYQIKLDLKGQVSES
jgi:hypothetical protein